jgi:uncharacterized protein YjbI with pentapeptide repeats
MASQSSAFELKLSEDVEKIVSQHELWLKTNGGEGARADLSGKNLRGSVLSQRNLSGADLTGAQLAGARLDGTEFRGAVLRNADFGDDAKLMPGQFSGADLQGAKMPDLFDDGDQLDKASSSARWIFRAMLLSCGYFLLMIATISEAQILTSTGLLPLPFTGSQSNQVFFDFFMLGPPMLLGLFIYFHIYLHRLRERLAGLPAVFPDGVPLYRKVYPWMLSEIACRHYANANPRPHFHRLQNVICGSLSNFLVPIVLFYFWLTYLPLHRYGRSIFHTIWFAAAVAFSLMAHRINREVAQGKGLDRIRIRSLFKKAELRKLWSHPRGWEWALFGVTLIAFFVLTYGAVRGYRPNLAKEPPLSEPEFLTSWIKELIPWLLDRGPYSTYANLTERDLSVRITNPPPPGGNAGKEMAPDSWTPSARDYRGCPDAGGSDANARGARLKGQNLRYAQARGAFLANGDLRDTDLFGADLSEARLQGAHVSKNTNFAHADLKCADLTGVEGLEDTNFKKARNWLFARYDGPLGKRLGLARLFSSQPEDHSWGDTIDLSDTNLRHTDLSNKNLVHGKFSGADMDQAQLAGADVFEADFRQARNLTADQVRSATNWLRATYDTAMMAGLRLADNTHVHEGRLDFRRYNLRGNNLSKHDLSNVNLQFSELQGTKFVGADLTGVLLTCATLDRDTDFTGAKVTPEQIRTARWEGALTNLLPDEEMRNKLRDAKPYSQCH